MWIVPSEFSKALEGLAGLAGAVGGGGGSGDGRWRRPGWRSTPPAAPHRFRRQRLGCEAIPTDGWFDSNLPPAAPQPEAANLRASDDDPDSRAAHEGITDMLIKRPAAATRHADHPAG